MEGVAVLVCLRFVSTLVTRADSFDAVLTERVAFETAKEVPKGLLPDAAQPTRGEFEPTFLLVDESCLAEGFSQF